MSLPIFFEIFINAMIAPVPAKMMKDMSKI